jgi:hypothetical protein
MIPLTDFTNLELVGGFRITHLEIDDEPLTDALGRDAVARTAIIGKRFELTIRSGLSEKEFSVTLYHEILEAAAVASDDPPECVLEFNESHFEAAAYAAHESFGPATPCSLNQLLQSYGFRET